MHPPVDPLPIAKLIVTASYRDGAPVTNLQVQKILFSLNAMHVIRFGAPLLAEAFDQTPYGPVYPAVFEELDRWGGARIEADFPDLPQLDPELEQFVLQSARLLRDKPPYDLMQIHAALKGRI